MIRLNLTAEPRWIEILPGLRLKAAPVTTAVMASARADLSANAADEQEIIGVVLAKAVARRIVTEWEGVGDHDGNPAPVTPEGIDALLDIWPVFEAFQTQILGPHLVLEQEKNVSTPSPTGTMAGATDIARPAAKTARTARQG